MTDDFSNHPKSLAEVKADREQDGRLWKPRDALIDALRDLDAGKVDIEDIIIIRRGKSEGPDGGMETTYVVAGPSGFTIAVGMLSIVTHNMLKD